MRRVSKRAYERYIGNILGLNPETNDVDNPTKVNIKKLYSLLKHSKQDNSGISSLKVTGRTFTANADKANSLNQHFQSAFSPESPSFLKALAQMTLQDLEDSGVNQPIKPSPYTKYQPKELRDYLRSSTHIRHQAQTTLHPLCSKPSTRNKPPSSKLSFKNQLIRPNYLKFGKKLMCPQYSKRVTELRLQTTGQSPLHVSYVKYWNTRLLQTYQNIAQT